MSSSNSTKAERIRSQIGGIETKAERPVGVYGGLDGKKRAHRERKLPSDLHLLKTVYLPRAEAMIVRGLTRDQLLARLRRLGATAVNMRSTDNPLVHEVENVVLAKLLNQHALEAAARPA